MAMSKSHLSAVMHLQIGLRSITLRLKSTAKTDTPEETRLKVPARPYIRFRNKRQSKILAELQREGAKKWMEMSEESKRPYFEAHEAAMKVWKAERAQMEAQLEAIEGEGKSSEKEKYGYIGWYLFQSEIQVSGATDSSTHTKMAGQLWHDLTPDEREVYNERARKIKQKGQKEILASVRMRNKNFGKPNASMQFRREYMSGRLKEVSEELKREWTELSDEERGVYVNQYQEDLKLYFAQKEEYRSGDKYAENQRNKKVLRAKIKEIEESMNKPQFVRGYNAYHIFLGEKSVGVNKGKELWRELPEDERMMYKDRWSKLKADWETDVAEWEELNKDNPKMMELKAYKMMLGGVNSIHKT